MKDHVDGLIEALLNPESREDEQDDAAMYLGHYNDPRALKALIQVGSDPNVNFSIRDSCGASIGRICIAMNYVDESIFTILTPIAQQTAFAYIMSHNPELISQPLRDELVKRFQYES